MIRSGCTTKMLQQVIEDVNNGKEVYVVASFDSNIRDMKSRLQVMSGNRHILDNITFCTPYDRKVDLRFGTVLGKDAVEVYADHYVLESQNGWLLEQWIRWNKLDGNWNCPDKPHNIECDLDEDCTCK